MEATYYKDTMRSYMIIPCPEEAETENYQYRMLEMNRITGLLPCGLRHIDGMRYLYYDITGKQSMQSLYEGRKVSGTEFLRLIRELDRVSESISGYLLDEQHLILSQEQVFYELQTGNYYFTYYPGEIMPPEIFRFLADSIDGTDKSTAAAAYRLSSVARGDRQTLREAIREEAAEKEDLPYPYEASVGVETYKGGRSIRNSSVYGGNFRQEEFMDADEEQEQMISEEDYPTDRNGTYLAEGITGKGRKKKKKRHAKDSDIKKPLTDRAVRKEAGVNSPSDKKQIVIRILLILFALCGAGGLLTAQFLLYISRRERRLCIAGAILLVIAAGLVMAEMILHLRRERRRRQEEEKNATPVYKKSDEENLPRFGHIDMEEYRLSDDENGNTVQLSEQENPGRLYGHERGSRIDLRALPVTIGKAQSYADIILSDPSISRVHARIYRGDDGGIEIRDLDSTNGTWINGVRLMPNEKKTVHRGDEVRFGNMDFEYR